MPNWIVGLCATHTKGKWNEIKSSLCLSVVYSVLCTLYTQPYTQTETLASAYITSNFDKPKDGIIHEKRLVAEIIFQHFVVPRGLRFTVPTYIWTVFFFLFFLCFFFAFFSIFSRSVLWSSTFSFSLMIHFGRFSALYRLRHFHLYA